MSKTYTTPEAAEILGVDQRTLVAWCRKGVCGFQAKTRGAWALTERHLKKAEWYRDQYRGKGFAR